jgi:hypothetical protein
MGWEKEWGWKKWDRWGLEEREWEKKWIWEKWSSEAWS